MLEMSAKEKIDALSSEPVQKYILDHEHHDVRDLVLKHKEILGIPAVSILEQIATRGKAKVKLPLYYHTSKIIFPPAENFEQSSSESTAFYKSEILRNLLSGREGTVADLTGGFGVDTYFLSKVMQKVDCVEPQTSLMEIARHNHSLLGASNINYHLSSAEDFVRSTDRSFDIIYADPSRRTDERKKIHALEDSQPDVLKLKAEIFKKTRLLLIKASPLLDIQAGMTQLANVRRVYVVSVTNECKEILFLLEKDFEGDPVVDAVNLQGDRVDQRFEFSFPEERKQTIHFSDPLKYLYEPNASILKAGAFKSVASRFNLRKIQVNTHLYTGDQFIDDFPGRKFLVEASIRPDRAEVKKSLPDGKANVTTRNYPLTPEALKKKTGLKDGGEKFLIGFSGQQKKYLVVASRL